jgi:hypothetical protein
MGRAGTLAALSSMTDLVYLDVNTNLLAGALRFRFLSHSVLQGEYTVSDTADISIFVPRCVFVYRFAGSLIPLSDLLALTNVSIIHNKLSGSIEHTSGFSLF